MAELKTRNSSETTLGRSKSLPQRTITTPRIAPKETRTGKSDFQLLNRADIWIPRAKKGAKAKCAIKPTKIETGAFSKESKAILERKTIANTSTGRVMKKSRQVTQDALFN